MAEAVKELAEGFDKIEINDEVGTKEKGDNSSGEQKDVFSGQDIAPSSSKDNSPNNQDRASDGQGSNPGGQDDEYWGFSLFEAYKMAVRFYKDNEGKRVFTMEYDDKVYLAALTKQVSCGPYANQSNLPEVGYLDLFGRDRRQVWDSFADMSSTDARRKFIEKLNESVNVFAPHMVAHQKEKEEKLRLEEIKRKEEEAEREREQIRLMKEEEERLKLEQEQKEQERLRQEQEKQKQQVMAALNAQTHAQFQQYAAQQHPGNPDKQAELIKLLQEQHYQQYVMLCLQQQQQQQQQQQSSSETTQQAETVQDGEAAVADAEEEDEGALENHQQSPSDSEDSTVQLAEASLWTRPQIDEFKQQIKRDPESVLVIGRGEVVTIRVPTHEEGAYVFWEFASDHYDLGFGVMFEWSEGEQENFISVQMGESSEEEEEETDEDGDDPERGIGGSSSANHPPVDQIVPIYRRTCHTEVQAGSHRYPGRGVYLLKFDNSYSLWRSKTLYYRVYNTR